MCGRFTMVDPRAIANRYARYRFPQNVAPSYNVAPTDRVLALCGDRVPDVDLLEWGFLSGSFDGGSQRTVNARSESVAEKPLFREAFRSRRCIVFADGYYEWKTEGKRKRPFYFTLAQGEPFAFAGLWNPYGSERLCCLMTTTANPLQAAVHDRSPVILASDDRIDAWLAPGEEADGLQALLQPVDPACLRVREVHHRVNSVRVNDASCLGPPEPSPEMRLL